MTDEERIDRLERAISQLAALTERSSGAFTPRKNGDLITICNEVRTKEHNERLERERAELLDRIKPGLSE